MCRRKHTRKSMRGAYRSPRPSQSWEVVGEVVPSATDHLPEALDGAPRLVLVPAGSADALRFDHADVLREGGEAPLSANGKHVGLPNPSNFSFESCG